MPLHILGLAKWLLTQAGVALFGFMKDRLLENVGLQSPQLTDKTMETLLDQQFRQLEERLVKRLIERMDEDRLVTFRSGIYQLNMAAKIPSMTPLKQSHLMNALNKFADIASLPEQGSTGSIPNTQLSCLAHLGIAAIYVEMHESLVGIANNIAAAVYSDQMMVRRWFGDDVVDRLLVICPRCGFENEPDDRFCQLDGQPLATRNRLVPAHSHSASSSLLIAYCAKGHRVIPGATFCSICNKPITAVYCSHGHANLSGATRCSKCGEELAFSL